MTRQSGAVKRSVKRVAVVHDWLTGMRGGEVVLEAILRLYPDADLFTLLYNKGSVSDFIANRTIKTSFIDSLPFKSKRYRNYLPLFPTAIELFDFRAYDLVISSSHCVARGVIVPPGIPHISYFHSPMRYVWDMYHDYFGPKSAKLIAFFANYLRMWDVSASPRVDTYISNSAFVAERIRRFYGREASVVNPPCLEDGTEVPDRPGHGDHYLIVSAFAPYKRLDLALDAFSNWDRRLIVVGGGQDEKKLRSKIAPNIEFAGNLPRSEIMSLYRTARGLIFPGLEDFGIVPVESQAQGCPVIAFGRGGALETVVNRRTGVFFYEQTVESLRSAVEQNERIVYRKTDFEKNIKRFTQSVFLKKFAALVEKTIKASNSRA